METIDRLEMIARDVVMGFHHIDLEYLQTAIDMAERVAFRRYIDSGRTLTPRLETEIRATIGRVLRREGYVT